MKDIYPYLLAPAYKDYIWGGSRIPATFNRSLPAGIYAESWEVSDREEGSSTVMNGIHSGRKLPELLAMHGTKITGSAAPSTPFPLLIKIIDAADHLSVQVHPNDSNAHLTGGEAKTEMWYVLDAADDASIYAGLKPGTDRNDIKKAISENRLQDCLNCFKPLKGQVFFIPGGMVHAIGKGCLLLEVQQNSNTTYRVYDWGRTDSKGASRPLHIDEALKVIDWNNQNPSISRGTIDSCTDSAKILTLLKTKWFCLKKLQLITELNMKTDGSSFHALFSEKGSFEIITADSRINCPMGQTCLVPASIKEWTISAQEDPADILCSSL